MKKRVEIVLEGGTFRVMVKVRKRDIEPWTYLSGLTTSRREHVADFLRSHLNLEISDGVGQ